MVVLLVEHLCVGPYSGFISRTSLCRFPIVLLLVEHLCVGAYGGFISRTSLCRFLWWFY